MKFSIRVLYRKTPSDAKSSKDARYRDKLSEHRCGTPRLIEPPALQRHNRACLFVAESRLGQHDTIKLNYRGKIFSIQLKKIFVSQVLKFLIDVRLWPKADPNFNQYLVI